MAISFTMTRAEAISVQERFFQLMKANGYDEEDSADKVLGIVVTWGFRRKAIPILALCTLASTSPLPI
jgi:hypothetical protein